MTNESFFDNQTDNWNSIVERSIQPRDVSAKMSNGVLVVNASVKLVSAIAIKSSHLIEENHVFTLSDFTTTEGDQTGLEVIDEIAKAFFSKTPIELNLRVYDSLGYSNAYKTDVTVVETDDSTQEDCDNPRQAIIVTSGNWELISTTKPTVKKIEVKEPPVETSTSGNTSVGTPKTDFDHFTDYLRNLREKAYEKSMKDGNGFYSTSFTQTTDKNGKTTVRHSINNGEEETNVFDKNGKLIDHNCNCGGCCCHKEN